MCDSRTLNNKINKLHERGLRLAYDNRQSTFEELLNIDASVTIRRRNLQVLVTELYKVHHGLSPELMSDIFIKRTFNIRNKKYEVCLLWLRNILYRPKNMGAFAK